MPHPAIHQHVTWADKLLIGALLIVTLASYPLLRAAMAAGEGDRVRLEADGREFATVALRDEQTLVVLGPLGKTEIVIRNQAVFVRHSPCRAKICVNMGPVSQAGQMVVCVPNKVTIRVLGKTGAELPYDAISR